MPCPQLCHHVRPGGGEPLGGHFRRDPHHRAVVMGPGVKHDAGDDGKPGAPSCFHRQFRFLQLRHRFDDQGFGAGVGQNRGLFGKRGPQFVLADLAGHQHLAGRSDRGKHVGPPSSGLARNPHALAIDGGHTVGQVVAGQRNPIGAKRVGQHDLAAGLDVLQRYLLHNVGVRQVPLVGTGAARQALGLQLSSPVPSVTTGPSAMSWSIHIDLFLGGGADFG